MPHKTIFQIQLKFINIETYIKKIQITVSCEGYNYAEDPYILKGSCGLEYDLEYRSGAGRSSSGGSWVDTKSK